MMGRNLGGLAVEGRVSCEGRISCGRQKMQDFCVWSQACWFTAVVLKSWGMGITTSLLSVWAKNEFRVILGYRVRPCCNKTDKQTKRKEKAKRKSKKSQTDKKANTQSSWRFEDCSVRQRTARQEYRKEQKTRGQGISQGVLLQCGKVVRQDSFSW